MITVFLGGTCAESKWRDILITKIDNTKVDAFNPIVDNWNEQAQANEIWHRENDDICLYVLTPEMEGYYSIAEVVDDSNKRPNKTAFCVLEIDNNNSFNKKELKSLLMIQKMVVSNGAKVFLNLDEIAHFLNSYEKEISY